MWCSHQDVRTGSKVGGKRKHTQPSTTRKEKYPMERKEKHLTKERETTDRRREKHLTKERETFDRIKREHPTEKGERIPLATIAQEIRAISGQESPTVSPRSHLIMLQYPQHAPNPQNKFPVPHYKALHSDTVLPHSLIQSSAHFLIQQQSSNKRNRCPTRQP